MEIANAVSVGHAKIEELGVIKTKLEEVEEGLAVRYIQPIERFLKLMGDLEFDFASKVRREVAKREVISGGSRKGTGEVVGGKPDSQPGGEVL
jgi:hypothetical protein